VKAFYGRGEEGGARAEAEVEELKEEVGG